MLTQQEIDTCNEHGYLLVENAITPAQLDAMREATRKLIDQSRAVTESDDAPRVSDRPVKPATSATNSDAVTSP